MAQETGEVTCAGHARPHRLLAETWPEAAEEPRPSEDEPELAADEARHGLGQKVELRDRYLVAAPHCSELVIGHRPCRTVCDEVLATAR